MGIIDWLDDLDDDHGTPLRWLAWVFLAIPGLVLHTLLFGSLLGLAQLMGERPAEFTSKARGWVGRLDPRFRALVRALWLPYLLAWLFLGFWNAWGWRLLTL